MADSTRRVFQYEITPSPNLGRVRAQMPRGADVLSVGTQTHGDPSDPRVYVWALVDASATLGWHQFCVVRTGSAVEFSHAARFLGTVHMLDGTLVFHIFDYGEE